MLEIGPIFRSLMHSKGRFWLVAGEVALTLAIVANCTMLLVEKRRELNRPTGLDEANILVVRSEAADAAFKDRGYMRNSIDEDLRALRAESGVVAVTRIQQVPLSGGGSSTGRKPKGSEINSVAAPYFVVGRDAVKALGVQIIQGRDFLESDFRDPVEEEADTTVSTPESPNRENVIVTKHFADKLFPDGDALGKEISDRDGSDIDVIVGIMERMHCSWPQSEIAEDTMLYAGNPGGERGVTYMVRAEPDAVESLYTSLDEKLLAVNAGRMIDVKTLAEIKARTYNDNTGMQNLLSIVIGMLFIVTSLGIFGLTTFSVTQRRRQIGTRRALGATRLGILRYFLVESWIITGLGLTVGAGLSYALNRVLVGIADAPPMEVGMLALGILVFWLVGVLAALFPAMRSTVVPPVIATRTV